MWYKRKRMEWNEEWAKVSLGQVDESWNRKPKQLKRCWNSHIVKTRYQLRFRKHQKGETSIRRRIGKVLIKDSWSWT